MRSATLPVPRWRRPNWLSLSRPARVERMSASTRPTAIGVAALEPIEEHFADRGRQLQEDVAGAVGAGVAGGLRESPEFRCR